jgi:glycosyltransferase involved in cell wall biosynthesis
MKIVNAMFGAKLGGLEQVFVDYGEAWSARGHQLVNMVTPGAGVIPALDKLGLSHWAVANFNQYDLIARARIRAKLKAERPDVVIAQGNRAINLLKPAAKGLAPFIAVNHSINIHRTIGADFVIAINDDMKRRLIAAGQPEASVFKLFNMVREPASLPAPTLMRAPPTIGAMGRFVAKKGFDVFIDAVAKLRDEGVAFKAVLAGDGELAAELKARAAARKLDDVLSFPGWVTDKASFFNGIDVFCFTSSHDVCPVVLLEAFLFAKPTIITDCPGPREISDDGADSLLFPIDDAGGMAEAVKKLIAAPDFALRLATAAQRKILDNHTFEKAGEKLEAICRAAAGL